MENFSFTALANEITEMKEEGITFEDKQLKWNTADDVKDVVTALDNQKVVHFLRLEGNTLGVEAAAAIGKALERHSEFRKALWHNMFTGRLKHEIPKALEHLGNGLQIAKAQLAVLDLSDNALGPNGMEGLKTLLRSPVCYTLQQLRLNNCGLGIYGGRMLSDALLDCHKSSTDAGTPLKLKVFVAGRNRLENAGAQAIAKIFATVKTLEEITMPQNSIYHEGIKALAKGFEKCANLKVLNLNDNTVTHVGANFIADALKATPHLRELNLGDCLLKTDGAYVLAEALSDNHLELEVVDLDCNEIGSDGGLALVQALQNKPKLKKLGLNDNQFGHLGCQKIVEAMTKPGVLQPLDDDQSEDEENDDAENVDDDDDEDEDGEEEEVEDEDAYSTEHDNDTTEEADEDEYIEGEEDEEEEAAYVTTEAFSKTNLNQSWNQSDTLFCDTTQTMTPTNVANACSAQKFCLSRSPCTLLEFDTLPGENKFDTLFDFIKQYEGDNYLLLLIFTALKCAHLSQSSTNALAVAKSLYRAVLEHAVKSQQERAIVNYLLKQLGLLRSEEKFKSAYDQSSCRLALKSALENYKVPSDYMKMVLETFLKEATH